MGKKDTTVFASSDHGFAPQWLAINARKLLFDTTVHNTVTNADVSVHPSGNPAIGSVALSNCRAQNAADLAKACWAGGTTQIYVNPTLPAGITYEAVRTAVINKFQALDDPATPGRQVMLKIMKKEELRNVDGTDALHPNRSGDVVRRAPAAVPVRRGDGRPGRSRSRSSSASTATCRTSSTSSTASTCTATFVASGPGRPPSRAGVNGRRGRSTSHRRWRS